MNMLYKRKHLAIGKINNKAKERERERERERGVHCPSTFQFSVLKRRGQIVL